jgi:hypothetical protein
MGAVLNIVGGPISLSYYILSPVEERIECLKDQCLVSFFFRVGHSPQYCSGSGA